jgi:hypothetical protein
LREPVSNPFGDKKGQSLAYVIDRRRSGSPGDYELAHSPAPLTEARMIAATQAVTPPGAVLPA